ncbi:MAG: amidohydrolase, partial [Caldilineaceae bacterium]|nr:amidohydrolase [Caldilineaceae bacterium]
MTADLIITNATIYTMDPAQPTAEAFAIRDGKFLAVGAAPDIDAHRGPQTKVVDLRGAPVLPGLCDAHIHFTHYALSLRQIPIFEVPSLEEMLQRVATKAAETPHGQWLTGWGWNHTLWTEPRFPTRYDLDRVAQHHPVILREKSGHSAVVNTVALQLAGVDAKTPNPAGGELVRGANGALTGMLLEGPAIELVTKFIPEPTDEEVDAAVLVAQENAHRFGLVAVHDLDGKRGFGTFQRLRNRGQLKLRAVTHISMEQLPYALGVGLRTGLGDEWLHVGGLKLFADGALGPRTAAMIEPYENEPDNYGITIIDKEEMLEMASKASAAGMPTVIHAIGDRANHDVLDVFAEVRKQEAAAGIPRTLRRHRIEHVQVLHPDDLHRLAALDVIASVQPIHATQDMNNVDAFWGKRGDLAYAFRQLLDSGARMAFGSDAPVETPNPFVGIHAAVTRRRADGYPNGEGWHPSEKLTVAEAVAGYTTGAAYAESLDDVMGAITPGKYADFIVPDRNIFDCDPMAIKDTQVLMTVVGGTVV